MLPEDPANGPENPENGGEGESAVEVSPPEPDDKLAAALQPPPLDEASEAYLRRAHLAEDRLGEVLGAYRQLKRENEGFRERQTRNLERRFDQRRERLLLKFIEILDNLDRALEAAETTYTGDPMIQGLILVRTQLLQTLKDEGLERVPVLGLPFDPATSEAVATRPVEEREHHHLVVKDMLRGYRLNGRLVRPARVVVGEHAGAEERAVVADEALLSAPTAEVSLPADLPPLPDAEEVRRTPTFTVTSPRASAPPSPIGGVCTTTGQPMRAASTFDSVIACWALTVVDSVSPDTAISAAPGTTEHSAATKASWWSEPDSAARANSSSRAAKAGRPVAAAQPGSL